MQQVISIQPCAIQYKCTCTARERRALHVMHELERARARAYMYHRHTQRMAQIVHRVIHYTIENISVGVQIEDF